MSQAVNFTSLLQQQAQTNGEQSRALTHALSVIDALEKRIRDGDAPLQYEMKTSPQIGVPTLTNAVSKVCSLFQKIKCLCVSHISFDCRLRIVQCKTRCETCLPKRWRSNRTMSSRRLSDVSKRIWKQPVCGLINQTNANGLSRNATQRMKEI